jgi:hypothetical protein
MDCGIIRWVDPNDPSTITVVTPDPSVQYAAKIVEVPACPRRLRTSVN